MTDKLQNTTDDFLAPACDSFFEILYQDNDILLINKPSGLLSLSGKNPHNWDSVHYRLVNGQKGVSPAFLEAKLIHRLDYGTSGIMVVGLNAQSTKNLNKQFQERKIDKRYIAVLDGWLKEERGIINGSIAKDTSCFPRVKICSSKGKPAETEYQVLKRLEQPHRSIVQFIPHTGRTHQLRIHSQLIGHPILGCDLYANAYSQQLSERLLLHASDLYFYHPITGEKIHGSCPYEFT